VNDWTGIEIEVPRRFRQRLGDISLEDVQKEGYNGIEEFKETRKKIHGYWDPNLVVWVYEFKLVNADSLKII